MKTLVGTPDFWSGITDLTMDHFGYVKTFILFSKGDRVSWGTLKHVGTGESISAIDIQADRTLDRGSLVDGISTEVLTRKINYIIQSYGENFIGMPLLRIVYTEACEPIDESVHQLATYMNDVHGWSPTISFNTKDPNFVPILEIGQETPIDIEFRSDSFLKTFKGGLDLERIDEVGADWFNCCGRKPTLMLRLGDDTNFKEVGSMINTIFHPEVWYLSLTFDIDVDKSIIADLSTELITNGYHLKTVDKDYVSI